jgi:hypothetical protein
VNALTQLPISILAVASFLGTSIFLYYIFKVQPYNRIGLSSFVFWGYSTTLLALLDYLGIFETMPWSLFIGINVIFILWLIFGIYISFKKGPVEQKLKAKKLLVFLFGVTITSMLFIVLAKLVIKVTE